MRSSATAPRRADNSSGHQPAQIDNFIRPPARCESGRPHGRRGLLVAGIGHEHHAGRGDEARAKSASASRRRTSARTSCCVPAEAWSAGNVWGCDRNALGFTARQRSLHHHFEANVPLGGAFGVFFSADRRGRRNDPGAEGLELNPIDALRTSAAGARPPLVRGIRGKHRKSGEAARFTRAAFEPAAAPSWPPSDHPFRPPRPPVPASRAPDRARASLCPAALASQPAPRRASRPARRPARMPTARDSTLHRSSAPGRAPPQRASRPAWPRSTRAGRAKRRRRRRTRPGGGALSTLAAQARASSRRGARLHRHAQARRGQVERAGTIGGIDVEYADPAAEAVLTPTIPAPEPGAIKRDAGIVPTRLDPWPPASALVAVIGHRIHNHSDLNATSCRATTSSATSPEPTTATAGQDAHDTATGRGREPAGMAITSTAPLGALMHNGVGVAGRRQPEGRAGGVLGVGGATAPTLPTQSSGLPAEPCLARPRTNPAKRSTSAWRGRRFSANLPGARRRRQPGTTVAWLTATTPSTPRRQLATCANVIVAVALEQRRLELLQLGARSTCRRPGSSVLRGHTRHHAARKLRQHSGTSVRSYVAAASGLVSSRWRSPRRVTPAQSRRN